jgi:hypothetical protein
MRHALATAIVLLTLGGAAHAKELSVNGGGFFEIAGGATIPIANASYTNFADTTGKLALRFGWNFRIKSMFYFAPYLMTDWTPINTNDRTFSANAIANLDAGFHRFRFAFGGSFVIHAWIFEFMIRLAFGAENLRGSIVYPVIGRQEYSSWAFLFNPSVVGTFRVHKNVYVGAELGVPISTEHTFGSGITRIAFTAVDLEVLAILGFRFGWTD